MPMCLVICAPNNVLHASQWPDNEPAVTCLDWKTGGVRLVYKKPSAPELGTSCWT
eukprot:SAG22_NODE_3474_length_1690_cov_1.503457_4_plen_54_part_01